MRKQNRDSISRKMRQDQAQKRHEKYESKSPEQILNELDMKFGKGLGAKKERKRLQNRINENKN